MEDLAHFLALILRAKDATLINLFFRVSVYQSGEENLVTHYKV